MGVQSVHRAIDILYLFSHQRPRLGITEMGKLLGLSKTTIHGLVKTLVARGFLSQDPETRKYSLGLNLYELSSTLAGTLKINQVGTPAAQRLARELKMLVRIAIWDNGTMLVAQNLFPDVQDIQLNQLGPRVPAYCSGIGKAVLSALSADSLDDYIDGVRLSSFTRHTITQKDALRKEIEASRIRGYALDNEEFLMGVACIAVPIIDHTAQPVASISVSGGPDYLKNKNLAAHTKKLKQTASEISRYMGHYPCPPSLT